MPQCNHKISNTSYTAIYIIESFDKTQNAYGILAYGKYLCEDIESYKKSNKLYNIPCYHEQLHNKEQWDELWNKIEDKCQKGESPILHFICHGKPEGLKVVNEIIPWNEVLEKLRNINEITQNVYVTMNVCYSASICEFLMQIKRDNPFRGCICADGPVIMANSPSEPRFLSFYESLITEQNIEKAINVFREKIKLEKGKAQENKWVILSKDIDNMSYNIENLEIKCENS